MKMFCLTIGRGILSKADCSPKSEATASDLIPWIYLLSHNERQFSFRRHRCNWHTATVGTHCPAHRRVCVTVSTAFSLKSCRRAGTTQGFYGYAKKQCEGFQDCTILPASPIWPSRLLSKRMVCTPMAVWDLMQVVKVWQTHV